MKLGGKTIIEMYHAGKIHINPFHPEMVGPNSIDLHLGPKLIKVGTNAWCNDLCSPMIDPRLPRRGTEHRIQKQGFVLEPGVLYLGHIIEEVGSDYFQPSIDGRSSIGRDGLFVHISAGFGDVGFKRQWTLELFCLIPILVFAGERIAQAYFDEVTDNSMRYDDGKHNYHEQSGPVLSKYIYKEGEL